MQSTRVSENAVVAVMFHGVPHPAVILEDRGDKVLLVISGTGQHYPDKPAIAVDSHRAEGKSMRLHKRTYFYHSGAKLRDVSELQPWRDNKGKCPPLLASKLLAMALEAIDEQVPGALAIVEPPSTSV